MRRISAWILALAVVAGIAASAVAYARTSPGLPPAANTPAAATSGVRQQPSAAARPARPVTKVRWAPCPPGTRLEDGACVRQVVRTVALPAPPAPRTAAPAARPAPTTPSAPAAQPASAAPAAASSATTASARAGDRHDGEHEDGGHLEDGPGGHAEHDD